MADKMHWDKLLCPKRIGSEKKSTQQDDTRSHFQRDYDRIIFSSPFRRLQNKTQVFPLPGSVFVHNRLTHSLEVASVGRSLGNNVIGFIQQQEPSASKMLIEQIPTIVSTACLAHDLGNPPFGHSGEDSIRTFFRENESLLKEGLNEQQWNDLIRFEGNANALRLLTQQQEGKRAGGFRLSYPALSSIVKYPWVSNKPNSKKFGFFLSETKMYTEMASEMGIPALSNNPLAFARHPLVYLVEAADDICYQIMDIEDAHKLGILSTEIVTELFKNFFDSNNDKAQLKRIEQTLKTVTDTNEQIAFLRAVTIGKLIHDCSIAFTNSYQKIMRGEFVASLMSQLDETGSEALSIVKDISIKRVYNHKAVVEIELAGFQILGFLLERISNALLKPENNYSKKVLRLIPKQYVTPSEDKYTKLMSALDFVSGMTDVYALEMYRTLQGITIPGIS